MIIGLGTDIQQISQTENMLAKSNVNKERMFTKAEQAFCDSKHKPDKHYAGIWCAKEAWFKASNESMPMNQIEVRHHSSGKPHFVFLKPRYLRDRINLSISHSGNYATATVIIEDRD